ncbi:condensation domain-containing protein [Chryseobacterium tructae]|uniref:condensation domain-containing protein n=1 Tax=Chryseobacterium tructae TaxID=1037380 RepID=UPI0025B40380|nr:condensation domain-containing protein [Chryseobacterium tructae]MDN3695561.1 condensation domain-containing protein [Chryseobacterium tructae]
MYYRSGTAFEYSGERRNRRGVSRKQSTGRFVYHALNQGDKDDAYRVQLIWDYHSGIDIDHLKHSWKLIQKSYPTLRVRFDWNGEIVQVIDKEGELDWRYYDISNLDNESQEIFIQELTHKDRFEVYDLSKGSLFRVYLFKRGEKYYSCLFSNHHAILDGWSMPVILNSVHNAYMSLANDDIPVVSVDHAYALTQQYLQSYKAGSTSFWNNYMNLLEDHEDLSSLVKEEKRHIDLANHRHILNHQHITMLIEGERYRSLKEFTKEQGFTVNAVLQYLWHKQLSIYSGLKTSVVGTTVSGRSLPVDGIETSAGLYINTLPLIVNHREGKVTDHIMEVQDRISDLNTHSDVNLAELNHDGRRIFSSLFVYENYPIPKGGERNELGFEFRDSVEKLDYPLGVVAYEREGKVSLILNYDGHLFEKEMMAQLILGMETILSQILNSPDIISEAISYLTEDTLQKITEDWNDTWYEFPSDKTIHELFEKQVVKTPDHVALIYQDTKLLYSELNERSNRLAHYLINTYNLQPDELVPLCLERSENMIIAILAVWKAGAAYVPMDPSYPADRIKHILTDTGARVVLAQESTADQVQIIENGNVVSLDSTIFKNAFEEMSPVNPGANINSHNLAYVIYTSGTTGLPKGVMVEHKNVVNLISDLYSRYGLDDKDVILQFANYVFDPSVEQILLAILNGNSLLLTEDKSYLNEETFLKTLNDHNVSYINLTPSVLQNIDITQVKTMRKLASGGEALTIDLYNKLKGEHFNFLTAMGLLKLLLPLLLIIIEELTV